MKSIITRVPALVVTIVPFVAGLLLFGCSTLGKKGAAESPAEKSGAELWANNCQRCHNLRSPQSLSPAQWEVALLHMRVRANLTPEEHKKILEFLKSSN